MQQRYTYSYGSEARKLNTTQGRRPQGSENRPQRLGAATPQRSNVATPQRSNAAPAQPRRANLQRVNPQPQQRVIRSVEPKAVEREHISAQFLVFLSIFIIALGFSVTMYIRLSSDIIGYREECANLQSQYESLKISNDLYEQRINNSVDLNEIEKIAVCDLGMKLAGEGQIVVYSGEIEDYVKQYSDLPE